MEGKTSNKSFQGNTIEKVSSLASSSNILAVIAFFIFVVIMFTIILRLGISIITFIFAPKRNVKIITGIIAGNKTITITQDPGIKGSITIERSSNASAGIEFTWSVWINVTQLSVSTSVFQNIFVKGNNGFDTYGISEPNNGPGLYLAPNINSLV